MAPRAGQTCARIVRGARPSVQALLGGAEFSHSRPATTAYTATSVQGDNSSANKRGPVPWASSQGFHADNPKLLLRGKASQADDGRRYAPLAFTLLPPAAS